MATDQETIGTIVQKLALDMKEFETSIKKAEGLSKALKSSMSELGTLTVDPSGKLNRTLDDYSVKTGNATQSTREFFREQRMQDRIFKESVQSITGAVFALSLFTQGNEKADATTKKVTQSLLAGVGAANAAEFGFFGLGKSLSGIPGVVGRLGASMSNLAGPISIVIGIAAALGTAFWEMSESSDSAKESVEKQKKAVDDLAKAYRDLESAAKGTTKQNADFAAKERDLVKTQIARIKEYLDVKEKGEKVTLNVLGINQETRSKTAGWEQRVARSFSDVLTRAQGENKTPEELLADLQTKYDALSLLVNSSTVTRFRDKLGKPSGPPELFGPDKPSYIDQEYEANLRYMEGGKRLFEAFTERRERMEEKLAELQQTLNDRVAAAREASWQRDIAAVQNLGNVLASTFNVAGDSFIGKMLRALQIAMEVAKALRFAKSAEGEGLPGVLGIISSFLPGIGLFLNKNNGPLPASASDSVNSAYASGYSNGAQSLRMSGVLDISNGKYFLIQEMAGYNQHMASKTV